MSAVSARIVELGRKVGQSWSAIVLIVANLVPLGGVIFAGWSAFQIVWLFWFENVIIGGFNVLKMLTVGLLGNPEGEAAKKPITAIGQRVASIVSMALLVAFFAAHYGLFSFGHGQFVVGLLGKGSGMCEWCSLWGLYVGNTLVAVRDGLGLAILVLLASHAFSFVANFLFKREYSQYTRTNLGTLMGGPYARVMILHVAIILGAFFVLALGSPVGILALLVLLKIALDLALHLKEREHSGAIPIPLAKRTKGKNI